MPTTPADDAARPDRAQRPARGLRGRLDTPVESVPAGIGFVVGGWVVHERLRVDHVLVTVDDVVVGHARVDVPRRDVLAVHPHVHGATHRGWAMEIPPVTGRTVAISAYAYVESAEDEDPVRLGPWIRFAETVLPVVPTAESFGQVEEVFRPQPGILRVSGRAWCPGGLSRVELTTSADDAAWVRARHSLPLAAPSATPVDGSEADARLAGFAGYVRVPESAPATVRTVAVGLDGRRHELAPHHVAAAPSRPAPSEDRLATLLDRFESRIRGLREVLGDGGPARVMVASHALDLGGAQLYLSLLMDRLRERGLDFCVVSRSDGPLQAELEAAGIPLLVFGHDPRGREVLEGQVLQIAEFAVEHGVVGCLANSLPTFPAVMAAQRLGLPTSWAIHESFDLDVFWAEAYGGLPADVARSARDALAACDEVVFEATSTRDLYDSIVPDGHRALVRYGVDAAAVDALLAGSTQAEARAELGLAPDALVLACVGTVEPRKAQLSLVRAFARIPAERRHGVQLAVVGMNDTAYAHALRVLVADAALGDDVVLVDVTPDIYPYYLAADVLVSASDVESVPRTMLEAMLIGRPVAATAAFGVAELVTDGRTGFLCDPLDLGALQQLLERVAGTRREDLAAMGAAAREQVAREQDPEIYVSHFEQRLSTWVREAAR